MGDAESRAFDVEWEAQFAPEHRWIECPDGFIDQDDRWHGCPDCDP